MTDREKELQEILDKLEKDRPEIDRILGRPAIIDTGRSSKSLCRIPNDVDFAEKDGHTTYEVVGYFDANADDFIFNKIIRKLGYDYNK